MEKIEAIEAVTKCINNLVNDHFTGSVKLNFHKGNVSSKIEVSKSEQL